MAFQVGSKEIGTEKMLELLISHDRSPGGGEGKLSVWT